MWRWVRRVLAGLLVLLLVLAVAVRLTTLHPPEVAAEPVTCPEDAPTLVAGQDVTVMSWNVQYLAGKDYVFWYDLLDESGPDERPDPEAIARTLDEVVRVVRDVDPDVLLLQEVDDGAARTDGEDQLRLLLDRLPDDYACHTSAWYWRAAFVPHPRIMGSVGMKLSTVSRFRITESTRYQLAQIPNDPVTRQFDLKRAILEARLPTDGGNDLVVLNTHFDAFAQGTDTMQQQVAETRRRLDLLTEAGSPWVLGGDLNLLPPGRQYDDLGPAQQAYYQESSELAVLTDVHASVPSPDEANGPDRASWFTHFPNEPAVEAPDRTIDYLFHGPRLTLGDHEVRTGDTLDISDHLPVIATWTLP